MITIGIGNGKGGVGSTTLTFQLAALLQRADLRITIAETSRTLVDLHWCVNRAARSRKVLNCSEGTVRHLYLNDCLSRLRNYEHGSDFVLLDYSNGYDLATAMSHVQHWICPFGPLDARPTLETHRLWNALNPDASDTRQTFSAVLSLTPSEGQAAREPACADPRWNGEHSAKELAHEAPEMHVLRQRIRRSAVMADTFAGRDVFSSLAPEALAARCEIESVWSEVLAFMKGGGLPQTLSSSALSAVGAGLFRGSKGAPSAGLRP